MRNMSFAMTTPQIRNESKTVTRRFGWYFLKKGDQLKPVEKCQGLRRGEKVKYILPTGRCIEVVSAKKEPLSLIDQADCVKEGFPDLTPKEFIQMLIDHNKPKKLSPFIDCNRIEFKYVDED